VVLGAHFVTIHLALNSTFRLNCQQKFNFWAASRRKFMSSSTLLDVKYVPSHYRATTVTQLWATKKKNSPPADHRRLPTMAFGRWISTTKID
jgi:hypothetical protein